MSGKKKAQEAYLKIIKKPEYEKTLKEMAKKITKMSRIAPNEATIESYFDCELFHFFRTTFGQLGFEYNPIKEKAIDTHTCRNVLKGNTAGRADTAIASLIIEFKQPRTLSNPTQKNKAIKQIIEYMQGESVETEENYEGFVTDGVIGCFLTMENGNVHKENFYKIDDETLNRIIESIIQVKLLALNARNLVEGLCDPPDFDGISFKIMHALFDIVDKNISPKSEMLYDEWRQLFNLAHDDLSKQQAIIDRRQSLETLFRTNFSNQDDEYKALFCLQTAYAIIVKCVAFKVLSQVRYNKNLFNFYDSIEMDSETLRTQMADLEEGATFRQYGVTNLLEGDFFSWYTNEDQWNEELYCCLKRLFETLSRYADRAVITSTKKSQDFFKELYQAMVPPAVRHSLGEYYTKKWLAASVIKGAIHGKSKGWKALDPCCGSGTFLTVLIDFVIAENEGTTKKNILHQVLNRVTGIDLNPIAALTARVNYFINIAPYIEDSESMEIPVYLGDASNVPAQVTFDGINCLKYTINTIVTPIKILVPASMVADTTKFSQTMNKIELLIKNCDKNGILQEFKQLCDTNDLTDKVICELNKLAEKLVELETQKWNGVWARIITNFLTTANLGKFDVIVGNPPWVDWKSLPSGYRDKIKSLCISRKLFSGDRMTGGINLNICALITNVSAQNWLSNNNGILAFLMPEPLVFQQSYEGFRNLLLNDNSRLYFQKFVNWNKAGHPFSPVTQKFLTYYIGWERKNYNYGVKTVSYIKNVPGNIDDLEQLDFDTAFTTETGFLATCNSQKNFFTYVDSADTAVKYRLIGGEAPYVGREGIEFYPQELMVFTLSGMPRIGGCTCLKNMQNKKSKYKVPQRNVMMETDFLHPMIKGKDIVPFHAECSNYIVPFPYAQDTPKIPIPIKRLSEIAPRLAKYYQDNKKLILAQTGYNERIIGNANAEFYALARVGAYSFAKNYVVFRDNTKWAAAVVSTVDTEWGGQKRPVFQNHAVSICERPDGTFITLNEAYYICGILNSSIVSDYMLTSSDSRSFPIRPRINIPIYDQRDIRHRKIVILSKRAHLKYNDAAVVSDIVCEITKLYVSILRQTKGIVTKTVVDPVN